MKLKELHEHLDVHYCGFISLVDEYKHCLYQNTKNGKQVTIPKLDGPNELLPSELIIIACQHLEIPVPMSVEEELG